MSNNSFVITIFTILAIIVLFLSLQSTAALQAGSAKALPSTNTPTPTALPTATPTPTAIPTPFPTLPPVQHFRVNGGGDD